MKNFIRGIIALGAFILTFAICCRILTLKSEDGIKQMQSFYLQKENTVDVILLGSSHIYCDVNTGILWDEYGISAFDLGGAEQPYWNSYYFLKEALKTQKPKVIVMDVTIPGIRSVDYQPEFWTVTNLYGMKWNSNRIQATKASAMEEKVDSLLNPMNIMHTRYDELTKDDFADENRSVNYKGFDFRETTDPYETKDMTSVTETLPMREKEEKYYRMIMDYAKEQSVPLLLISVPFPVYNYEDAQKIYNYEFQIAKEENVPYIDFNKDGYYEKIGLDFETDLADEFHLNVPGHEKFTKYLGEYLQKTYDLQDHRGDAKYVSWEKDAAVHRQENISYYYLPNADTPGKYLLQLLNDNYIVFLSLGEDADFSAFFEENKNVLGRLGIGSEQGVAGNVLIACGDSLLYSSAEPEQRAFIDRGDVKLLMNRTTDADGDHKTKLHVNETEYTLNTDGVKILVYDKQLKRVVSAREFDL
ncbi:MAG: hypothetical protein IJU25_05275 [Lachnospiraceae bacterium]|nr:hypothetical protein [Lachnospiraceae bacterium]